MEEKCMNGRGNGMSAEIWKMTSRRLCFTKEMSFLFEEALILNVWVEDLGAALLNALEMELIFLAVVTRCPASAIFVSSLFVRDDNTWNKASNWNWNLIYTMWGPNFSSEIYLYLYLS